MLNQIAAAGLAALTAVSGPPAGAAPRAAPDTTFTAPAGMRLEVQNRDGAIRVRGTGGDRVRIEVTDGPPRAVRVRRSGSIVRVSISERWREEAEDDEVDLRLEVPRGSDLRLQSLDGEIHVKGVTGDVEAQSSDEGIIIRGPARSVRAQSSDGDLVVSGARGQVDLFTADGDIRVTDAEGELRAESIDGDLVLRGVRSRRVEGSTTDGDILYDGAIRDGGEYRLDTHDGDIWVTVAAGTNAAFDVRVHEGDFDAGFEVPTLEIEERGRHYRLVLGDGSARVELRSFDGRIFLRRPGDIPEERVPFRNAR